MLPIRLNLKRHCVETEIRRVYNRTLSACLKNKDDSELEDRLEILQKALQELDFSYLRTANTDLAGGSSAEISLAQGSQGVPVITIDGCAIPIRFKAPKR